MNKLITFALVMTATGLMTLSGLKDPAPPPMISAKVESFDDKTTQMITKYRGFKDTLELALQALAQGKISLPEATARVHDAARGFCPIYLDRIQVAEQGTTPTERIARNLIGHLRGECRPCLTPRVRALERELDGFLRACEEGAQ
jgi:hypothetical protein